jgi:hypothetical protein
MRWLTLEKFAAAEFTGKFPISRGDFAANCHNVRPCLYLETFE